MSGLQPFGDIALLAAVVLFTRVLPRWLTPRSVSSDSYYHLICAEAIRRNGFRIPERIRGFCFPSPYDYPPLFHLLLALFPHEARERLEKWFSAWLDAANVLVFYWLVVRLDGIAWAGQGPSPLALSLLVAVSPALLAVGAGPRAYQATPRVLGELCFNLALAAALLAGLGDSWLHYGLGVAACALVFLSSKFSAQALVFMLPVMALALGDPLLAALPLLGLAAAVLLSGGHYWRVLKGHIGHLYLFSRWTAKHYPIVVRRNRWRDLFNLPLHLVRNRREAWRIIFLDNTFIILLMRHPQVFVPGWAAFEGWRGVGVAGADFLWAWAGASLLVFLLTSLRPLLFLGEPERYVEHGLMPLYLLAGYGAWQLEAFDIFCYATAVYSLVLYFAYIFLFKRLFRLDAELIKHQEEVYAFLKSWPGRLRLLPLGSIYGLAYRSGQEVFYSSGNFAIWYLPIEEFRRLYKILGLPRENLRAILDSYGLDGVVAFERAVAAAQRDYGVSYSFAGLEKVFENPSCSIWFRRGARQGAGAGR